MQGQYPLSPKEGTVADTKDAVDSLTSFVTKFTGFVSDVVNSVHKEAALVMGFLTAAGVVPVAAGQSKSLAALLVGYAAVCHIGDNFLNKTIVADSQFSKPVSPLP